MNEQTTSSKKISVGLILSWIFGVLFALTGIVFVFSEPIPGLVMLIMAAVLLPPISKLVDRKWKFYLSGGVKTIIVVVGLVIIGTTASASDKPATSMNESVAFNQEVAVNENTNAVPAEQAEAGDSNNQPTETTPRPAEQAAKEQNQPVASPDTEITPKPEPAPSPTPTPEPAPEPVPTSSETVSQANAVAKAKSYLSFSAFSHDGLVDQLEYEQFSNADATYGADNSGADWNAQAVKKAKSYLENSAFSYNGLVDQLVYEKFTQAQAVHGADNSGADWNVQAAKKAESYMEIMAYSRGGLIDQLLYEKFTQAQAEYGANAVGL